MDRKSALLGMTFGVGAVALVGVFWKEICDAFYDLTGGVIEDFGRSRG